MKSDYGRILLILVLALTVSQPAISQDWIDATHLFDNETRWLADNALKETNSEFQLRTRGFVQSIDVKPPQIGDEVVFNSFDVSQMKALKIPGILKKIGKHCYVYVQKGKNIPPSVVDKSARVFDEKIYPTNNSIFGNEWNPGIDDDPKITLFFLDIQDGYQAGGSQKASAAGYFYAGDEYSKRQNPNSNEREMLYLDINPADPTKDSYMSVVAHEFQHMIHWHHDPKEYTWVNESFSQLATFLNGFDHPSQLFAFIRSPDNNLLAWSKDTAVANYGQAYLFAYYMASHLASNESDRNALIKAIVNDKLPGIRGIIGGFKKQGKKLTFTQVFDGFCVANFINDRSILGGFYGYDKMLGKLKLAPAKKFDNPPYIGKGDVKCWSSKAFQFDLRNCEGTIRIGFAGQRQVSKNFSNAFAVSAILVNSSGRAPTKVEWLRLGPQGGDFVLRNTAGIHDTLFLVVCNHGPQDTNAELDFARSASAADFSFSISVNRKGTAQRIASLSNSRVSHRTARLMMSNIANRAPMQDEMTRILQEKEGVVGSISEEGINNEVNRVVAEESLLLDSIRTGIEKGELESLRDFFSFYDQASDSGKQNLESLRSQIEDVLKFEVHQNNRSDLKEFVSPQ